MTVTGVTWADRIIDATESEWPPARVHGRLGRNRNRDRRAERRWDCVGCSCRLPCTRRRGTSVLAVRSRGPDRRTGTRARSAVAHDVVADHHQGPVRGEGVRPDRRPHSVQKLATSPRRGRWRRAGRGTGRTARAAPDPPRRHRHVHGRGPSHPRGHRHRPRPRVGRGPTQDDAKAAGARWDGERGRWWAPEGSGASRDARWVPPVSVWPDPLPGGRRRGARHLSHPGAGPRLLWAPGCAGFW